MVMTEKYAILLPPWSSMEALVSPYPQPVSTEYGLCMRAIECLPSVTTSAATSVAKPGNPPGADSMEAVLQVLLTMASKNPEKRGEM